MINTELPDCLPMPAGTRIMKPEHGIYFEDGDCKLYFQRAKEISKAPTQHLTNLLTIIPENKIEALPHLFNKMIREEHDERFNKGEFIDDTPP